MRNNKYETNNMKQKKPGKKTYNKMEKPRNAKPTKQKMTTKNVGENGSQKRNQSQHRWNTIISIRPIQYRCPA